MNIYMIYNYLKFKCPFVTQVSHISVAASTLIDLHYRSEAHFPMITKELYYEAMLICSYTNRFSFCFINHRLFTINIFLIQIENTRCGEINASQTHVQTVCECCPRVREGRGTEWGLETQVLK